MSRRIKARQKDEDEEKEEEEPSPVIDSDDVVDFGTLAMEELPYLKCIELFRFKPNHFDLGDKWRPTFQISNYWMKRIYRHDIYRDTDFPNLEEPEVISQKQKKILNNYVQRKRRSQADKMSTKNRKKPPLDCLLEYLERPYGLAKSKDDKLSEKDLAARRRSRQDQALSSLNSDNLAKCTNHKVQPEDVIVELALEKMKELSPEEEQRYQELLKNRDFMQELNNHVERYISLNCNDAFPVTVDNQQQNQQPHNNATQT